MPALKEYFAAIRRDKIIHTRNKSKRNKRKENMGWITVYITGNADFRTEVLKKLESSNVRFMPGYTGGSSDMDTHDLYWLGENVDLRTFKQAIGSKLIWKYRLRFYTSLEEFIEAQKNKRKLTSPPAEDELFLGMIPDLR